MNRDFRDTKGAEAVEADAVKAEAVEADAWDIEARDVEARNDEARNDEAEPAEPGRTHADVADADAAEAGPTESRLTKPGLADVDADADADVTGPEAVETDAEPTTADLGPTESGADRPAEHHDLPATPAADGDPLIAPDQEHRFLERWSQAQISFVDDPHRAVSEAETLLEEVVAAQRTALEARRSEMNQQCHDSAADTEDLRLAMRGYGHLVSSLLSHTG